MRIFYILIGLFLVFWGILLLRAAFFRSKNQSVQTVSPIHVDMERSISSLQALIRCKTISQVDPSLEENAEFDKLLDLLPQLYPLE